MTRIVAMPNKCGVVALLAVLVSLLLLGKPLDLYFATSYDFIQVQVQAQFCCSNVMDMGESSICNRAA